MIMKDYPCIESKTSPSPHCRTRVLEAFRRAAALMTFLLRVLDAPYEEILEQTGAEEGQTAIKVMAEASEPTSS